MLGQVAITLNGRTYRLACQDGEEERLLALGNHVRGHFDRLTREFGQVGDDRLLAMVAILITDELFEARAALNGADKSSSAKGKPTSYVAEPRLDKATKP
ncbi:MAG: cell division protein ZapA [Hyphomicrobiaceae bacterium]|nr:MAG: cell division protein ZapA [Hyphomicrobiaceae bacterium]